VGGAEGLGGVGEQGDVMIGEEGTIRLYSAHLP
jgi:hypothetical protein